MNPFSGVFWDYKFNGMNKIILFFFIGIGFYFANCSEPIPEESNTKAKELLTDTLIKPVSSTAFYSSEHIADFFDFPVGKPDAKGYYNAQAFGTNNHLGDDWNAVTGGNSDLGDPIYAVANGYVHFAKDVGGGWGNVIRIHHQLPDGKKVESLYAHCDAIKIEPNTWVNRGQEIGTIGTANGAYLAHLHFEMRSDLSLPIGRGYAREANGYINPTQFITDH